MQAVLSFLSFGSLHVMSKVKQNFFSSFHFHQVAPARLSHCEKLAVKGRSKKNPLAASCDSNGMFNDEQCSGKICWCSQPDGKHMPNTFHYKKDKDAPECGREVGKSNRHLCMFHTHLSSLLPFQLPAT